MNYVFIQKNRIFFLAIVLLLLLILFFLPSFSSWNNSTVKNTSSSAINLLNYQHPPIPQVDKTAVKPAISTPYYILVDVDTNKILLSNNPNSRIYPASVTKLATALTALNIYPLDEVITVKQEYNEGKVMELKANEKITIRSLVNALLIYSANDAAFNLATHNSDGISGFVSEMNKLAQNIGLKNTHFTNVDGLHHPDHYSTPYDLAQLGRSALKLETIRDTVKKTNLTVTDVDGYYIHTLTTTNELLGIAPEIEGLKTGWTPEADGCFVGLINFKGHYLISVVAVSQDRFGDTQKIIDWTKKYVYYQKYQP